MKKIIFLTSIISLAQHLLLTKNVLETFSWIGSFSFLITFLILGSFLLFTQLMFNSNRLLFVVCSFIGILSLVSFIKNEVLGVPLLPWDFYAINETIMITKIILQKNLKYLIFTILTVLCFIYVVIKIPKNTNKYGIANFTGGFLSLVVFLVLVLAQNPVHDYLFKNKFKFDTTKQFSLKENGFLISFITLSEQGVLLPPSNFSEELTKKVLEENTLPNTQIDTEKPDVIVIMSESLFDPMQLKNIQWKKDVLGFSRSLGNKNINLTKVPTYGGKTANSEFEFLTGNSMKFFGPGTTPYTTITKGKKDSIVRSFKNNGYGTVAIHPGGRDAWDRHVVYPDLGFDKFIHGSQFKNQETFGNFMSDLNILPELKDSLSSQSGPSFHFIVTLQNHMPYDVNPFDLSNPLFDVSGIDKNDQVILNYYSKLVERTDAFHKQLVDFLKTKKRPTVLLIFGDHLPALNENYKILKKYGMINEDMSEEDFVKIHTTPLIVWSNSKNKISFDEKIIGTNFLGVSLLEKLKVPLSPYQNFVSKLYKENPDVQLNGLSDISLMKLMEQYHSLQYWMLSQKSEIKDSNL